MEPNRKILNQRENEESQDNSGSIGCGSIILGILMLIAAGFVFSIIGKIATFGASLPYLFFSIF